MSNKAIVLFEMMKCDMHLDDELIKGIDEAITELTQSKSCEGCEYEPRTTTVAIENRKCCGCNRRASDHYTPKKDKQ